MKKSKGVHHEGPSKKVCHNFLAKEAEEKK